MSARPGLAADAHRAWQAARAEAAAQQVRPQLASRAAELAARVASMVSQSPAPDERPTREQQAPAPAHPDGTPTPASLEVPTVNLTERAEAVRRSAARFAANSGRGRAGADREAGVTTRGNRHS